MLGKFEPLLKKRFKETPHEVNFHPYIQLVRDFTNYSLTPHTDAIPPHTAPYRPIPKVVVFLFYSPRMPIISTSGRHFTFPTTPPSGERFTKVITAEYKPNTMLGFFKTSFSFHGVEPVTETNVQRDLIQYSIVCRDDD